MSATSYRPISPGMHASENLKSLIETVIDPALKDIRFLMTVHMPDQGPKGCLQLSIAKLLLSTTDGASQLLWPYKISNGDIFTQFLKHNFPWAFPWAIDPPKGLTVDEACDFLWNDSRCALLHRFGSKSTRKGMQTVGYARIFNVDDEMLTRLDIEYGKKPYSIPTIERNPSGTTVWLESYYWSLRHAIQNSLDTPEKAAKVETWVASGNWDHK